jgi:hypothetical protein
VREESQETRGEAKPGNDLNDGSEVCVGHSDLIERRGHALQQKLPEQIHTDISLCLSEQGHFDLGKRSRMRQWTQFDLSKHRGTQKALLTTAGTRHDRRTTGTMWLTQISSVQSRGYLQLLGSSRISARYERVACVRVRRLVLNSSHPKGVV